MKRLLINADDFGLTAGVCQGIMAAMSKGVVGATTAMVCMPGSGKLAARFGTELPGRVGLHLMLTGGVPCLPPMEVPSLVDARGRFPRKPGQVGPVELDQVRREWRAQLARLCGLGVEPSHLDSHHHIHLRPELLPVYVELATSTGLPARGGDDRALAALGSAGVACAQVCQTDWFEYNISLDGLGAVLSEAEAACPAGGVIELMCHPGYSDEQLRSISTYNDMREQELAVLTDPATKEMISDLGLELCGPDELSA